MSEKALVELTVDNPAENDVPSKYLQQRMGHKNLEVTMKFYLHLTEKMQEKGSDILQRMYQAEEEKKENDA